MEVGLLRRAANNEALMTSVRVISVLYLSVSFLLKKAPETERRWLAELAPKRQWEVFSLSYGLIWIAAMAYVVITKAYEQFGSNGYMAFLVSLSLPQLLFPLFVELRVPLTQRFAFKANTWIAIFSYIGNYWYTHYFYTVLKARYSFPSFRLNNVPLCLYFATYFYFCFYHALSNIVIRKAMTSFTDGWLKILHCAMVVFIISYITAFIETISISEFPHYSFEDPDMALTIGSAFYGIYFIVSFPVFYSLDEGSCIKSLYSVVMESFGASMIVICLLDAVRLYLRIPFEMSLEENYN